jgi:hypothetical protein
VSVVLATLLERGDVRLLRVIVVVLRLCPSVHGVACEGEVKGLGEGVQVRKRSKGRRGERRQFSSVRPERRAG